MSNFKERLFEELEQLQDRIRKLDSFINSEKIKELEIEQQDLLKDQLHAMSKYEDILQLRITLLNT